MEENVSSMPVRCAWTMLRWSALPTYQSWAFSGEDHALKLSCLYSQGEKNPLRYADQCEGRSAVKIGSKSGMFTRYLICRDLSGVVGSDGFLRLPTRRSRKTAAPDPSVAQDGPARRSS